MGLFGMPGIGGSLGCCAVCRESFVKEVLLGDSVKTISMELIEDDLCVHAKCMPILERSRTDGWETLPDGPIRDAFAEAAEHNKRLAAEPPTPKPPHDLTQTAQP